MRIGASCRVARSAACLTAAAGAEEVALDLDRGVYVGFNPVASEIWRRIDQPVEVATLCHGLSADFAGDAATIEADVLAFLELLHDQGLIRLVD